MHPRTALIGTVLIGFLLATVSPAVGASQYGISIDNSIDIPTRTATVEGTEYQVSAVAQRNPGDALDVAVTSSDSDTSYRIYLYNEKGDIVQDSSSKTGDGQTSFNTGNLDPGSYYAAVYQGGIQKIHPIVIAGYDVSTNAPDSVEQGESASVTVDVTRTVAQDDPPQVQAVLGDEAEARRVNATRTGSGTYEATISTDGLSTGSYSVYGVIRGTEQTTDGRSVVLGLSTSHILQVTDGTATATPDPSDGTDGGSGTNSGDLDSGTGDTPTQTATATSETPTAATATATSTVVTTGPSTTTEAVTDTDDVIEPNPTDTEPATTTTTSQSGFGPLTAVVALALLVALGSRRR